MREVKRVIEEHLRTRSTPVPLAVFQISIGDGSRTNLCNSLRAKSSTGDLLCFVDKCGDLSSEDTQEFIQNKLSTNEFCDCVKPRYQGPTQHPLVMLLVCKNSGLVQGSPVERYPDWIQLDGTDDQFPLVERLSFYPTSELGSNLLNQFEQPLNSAILKLEKSLVVWLITSSDARKAFQEIVDYFMEKIGTYKKNGKRTRKNKRYPLIDLIRSGDPTVPQTTFRMSGEIEHLVELIAICCVIETDGLRYIYEEIKKAAEIDFDESEVIKLGGTFSVLALTYPSRPKFDTWQSISGLFTLSLCLACSGAYHLSNTIHHKDRFDTVQFVAPHVEPLLTDLISTLERCSSIIEISNSKQSEI